MTERPPVHGSGAYYRSRTDEQLRYEIDGNMIGSRAHDGALAEMERREQERSRKSEMLWIKLTFAATLLGIAATLLAGD